MTPAEELRTAAQTLRPLAEAAQHDLETADYWKPYDPATAWRDGFVNGFGGISSDLAAIFTPTTALALADLLDDQADGDDEGVINPWALALARQILGTTP
jgi:hypothetical protein